MNIKLPVYVVDIPFSWREMDVCPGFFTMKCELDAVLASIGADVTVDNGGGSGDDASATKWNDTFIAVWQGISKLYKEHANFIPLCKDQLFFWL